MYQKYHTDALILGGYERGESDRVLTLLTREFGLVRARARAVRRESSRMRYALQSFTRVQVSLVRGASGWRLAGARSLANLSGAPDILASFARIARLCERLVQGEERNGELFETIAQAHQALGDHEASWAAIELVCVARVLHTLGYLASESTAIAFGATLYSPETLARVEAVQEPLLAAVNRALAQTQL